MNEAIKKILDAHEKRIKILEEAVISGEKKKSEVVEKDYKGLIGGIWFLIDNGFLSEPKNVNDIMAELEREGYHYPRTSISKILSVNFTKDRKILNRIEENNVWKYVLRK